MAEVRVYTTPACGYCRRAKALLDEQGVTYREIDVATTEGALEEITALTAQRTFPQIVVADTAIGGYSELSELVRSDRLQELLGNGR